VVDTTNPHVVDSAHPQLVDMAVPKWSANKNGKFLISVFDFD
jgi:hypothetical protein